MRWRGLVDLGEGGREERDERGHQSGGELNFRRKSMTVQRYKIKIRIRIKGQKSIFLVSTTPSPRLSPPHSRSYIDSRPQTRIQPNLLPHPASPSCRN